MSLSLEALKLRRSRRPWVVLAALVLYVILMLFGFATYAETETGGNVEFRYTFENESYFNGLTFAVYAFYFAALLLLPVFASTEGGVQIAGERSAGTLPLLLSRPVSRQRVFLSKFAVAGASLAMGVGLFLVLVLGVGLVFVGWGELRLYPGVLQMTDRPQSLSQAEALVRFLWVWPAASLAMLAPLTLSLLISTWSRSAVNAVGLSVSIYLVLSVISEIHFFRELRPFLFTSTLGYWRGLFREDIPWSQIFREASRLLAFSAAFLGVGLWRFRRQEER